MTADQIIERIRRWATSTSTTKLPPEELYAMMSDIQRRAVETYDGIWFCSGTGQTTTTSGSRAADLPETTAGGRLVRPFTIYKMSGANRIYFEYLEFEEFKERYLDPEQETISDDSGPHCTFIGEEIWFGPTPTADETVYCEGEYAPPDINAGNLTTVFTTYASEFLLWGTLMDLVLYKFEEETRMNIFQPNFRRAKNAMMAASAGRTKLARRAVSRQKG